jgi:hypothetical protein
VAAGSGANEMRLLNFNVEARGPDRRQLGTCDPAGLKVRRRIEACRIFVLLSVIGLPVATMALMRRGSMEAAKKIIDECLCIQIRRRPRDTGHAINFPMDSIIFTAEGNVGDVSFVNPDQMVGE